MILTHTHPSEDKQSRPGALDTELVAVTYTVLLYATELQAKRYVRIFLKKTYRDENESKDKHNFILGKKKWCAYLPQTKIYSLNYWSIYFY